MIYKEVPNFPNYMASEDGHVYSKKRKIILKESILKTGYKQVSLCIDGRIFNGLVHRVVCSAFHSNDLEKKQVNHKNGIKTDNRADNLEWSTRSENQKHSIDIGLRHTRGEKNSQSKLNSEQVMEIFNYTGNYRIIAQRMGICVATICDIKTGRSWTHITNMPNLKKQNI